MKMRKQEAHTHDNRMHADKTRDDDERQERGPSDKIPTH